MYSASTIDNPISDNILQVFDQNGKFIKEFGTFGNGEGEFDCLAGIAVNRIGQYIIADRYNHRVQVRKKQNSHLNKHRSTSWAPWPSSLSLTLGEKKKYNARNFFK